MSVQDQARTGLAYYRTRSKIQKRHKYIYTEEGLMDDPYSANHKIRTSFYSMLVDQKVDYLIGKKPTCGIDDQRFFHDLSKAAKKASAQGIQWAYPYIKNGELWLKLFPTSELSWKLDELDNLVEMTREIEDGEGNTKLYVYTKDDIKVYKESVKESNYIETLPHFNMTVKAGATTTENGRSWGVVPFIPFKNNDDLVFDLEPIKALIDSYELVLSDFANNLEDFQDVYWVLKGYDGQDPSKFHADVKRYKSVKVGDGGEARAETINIPVEARMKLLEKVEALIFKFGRGVDMDKLSGGSLTNVAIEAHFSNLDQKANAFSYQTTEFINAYIDFYNIFADVVGKEQLQKVEVVYNKSMIVDEEGMLTANAGQAGFVSDETRWDHHPWTDAKTEMERQSGITIPDNPIPAPEQGEAESDFISRCTTFLINEGTEQEQAVAICQAQWSDNVG